MKAEFAKHIEAQNFNNNHRFLIAVSGGVDSMVLFDLFTQTDLQFAVAHCNFQLREQASDEENLVRSVCEEFKIEFFTKKFETKAYANEHGISTQMAARELRYNWFQKLCTENGFHKMVTAHHLNDSIETFLLNVTKGTGIQGLTGISKHQGKLFRPLLFATKDQILNYATENHIQYLEDSSNQSSDYQRNLIRNEVIPILKQINPGLEQTMQNSLKNLQFANEIYQSKMKSLRHKLIHEVDSKVIYIKQLFNYPFAQQVFYELVHPFGFDSAQARDVFEHLPEAKSGAKFQSETHLLIKDRDRLLISELTKKTQQVFALQEYDESIQISGAELRQKVLDKAEDFTENLNEIQVDAGLLSYPLVIRKWLPGDYFYPLGLGKKQKLKKFFINNKLSVLEKQEVLLLCSEQKVVWVINRRMDHRFRITEKTKKIVKFSFANK